MHVGRDAFEQPRNDVDPYVERRERLDEPEQLRVLLARERDHDAVDVELLASDGTSSHEPRTASDSRSSRTVPRLRIDEPDEVDAVLGMREQLAGDQLADFSGADDQRVLQVVVALPAHAARDATEARHSDEGEAPERQELRDARVGEPRDIRAGEQKPRADRDQMEDADTSSAVE